MSTDCIHKRTHYSNQIQLFLNRRCKLYKYKTPQKFQIFKNENPSRANSIFYSETLNNENIERIHQMSFSSLSENGMLQVFSFLIKIVRAYSYMDIYLFSQILKFK